jgi:enoyl-CoA hydratase/carnithine racemase
MSDAVRHSVADGIAVVTIDSPPVNAINRAVRSGLEQAFTALPHTCERASHRPRLRGPHFRGGRRHLTKRHPHIPHFDAG